MFQWSRLHIPNSGGPGLIPGQGTRSQMPQLKTCMLRQRSTISCAANKTRHSQLNSEVIPWHVKNTWAKRSRQYTESKILWTHLITSVSSVAQSCPTLCDPMNRSTPGLPVHHQLLEFTQTHVHWVSDAIQPSHPLSAPSPPEFNLSHYQSFQMSQLFASGGQSIGVPALLEASLLPITSVQDFSRGDSAQK